jgi:hypothetical protein
MDGAAKLEITVGDPASVQINGHEKAVRRIRTEVRGSTLHIKGRARSWGVRDNKSRLTIQITLPQLQSLEIQGGNDVTLTGLSGGRTTIKAAGAANISGNGQLDELMVRMSGAGHADLSKLSVAKATVTVDGVGNVIVNARDSLDATMNGVGAIFYVGSPRKLNTRMHGVGTIAQRETGKKKDAKADPDAVQQRQDGKTAPAKLGSDQDIII